jgi:hypothetical protein
MNNKLINIFKREECQIWLQMFEISFNIFLNVVIEKPVTANSRKGCQDNHHNNTQHNDTQLNCYYAVSVFYV